LLAVFIQSAQVYGCLDDKLFQGLRVTCLAQKITSPKRLKSDLYYTSSWFAIIVNSVDPQILFDYLIHPFIFYDNVVPYKESPEFYKTLQGYMSSNPNYAFLPASESKFDDWRSAPDAIRQADVDPVASGKLSILRSDVNTWAIKAHLTNSKFLVINDNYNSDWHAFINGRPARLLRANISFKGLWIPLGESIIVLRFSNPLTYGLHIALLALFVGTFLYLLLLLRRISPFRKPVRNIGSYE
jgi:hypothetical protein